MIRDISRDKEAVIVGSKTDRPHEDRDSVDGKTGKEHDWGCDGAMHPIEASQNT